MAGSGEEIGGWCGEFRKKNNSPQVSPGALVLKHLPGIPAVCWIIAARRRRVKSEARKKAAERRLG